jgi:gluconate 2-dehydrogenase gamma chain
VNVNDETTHVARRNGLTRMTLLRRAGVVAGALGVAGLAGCGGAEEPANRAALLSPDTDAAELGWLPPERPPLNCNLLGFFTPEEGRTVEAITARFIPGTPDDPGAREACVTGYIDHKLTQFASFSTPTYFHAPFAKPVDHGTPGPQEHASDTILVAKKELPRYGFQSSQTPQETYRAGLEELDALMHSEHGVPFVDLAEPTQDDVLGLMEAFGPLSPDKAKAKEQLAAQKSPAGKAMAKVFVKPTPYGFFSTVLGDTYDGMFADPVYGGNRDYAGWLLVGYPGAQRAWTTRELTHGPNVNRRVQGLREMPPMNPGTPAQHVILPISGTSRTEG